MPLERTVIGVSDPTQKPFSDLEHISDVSNVSGSRSISQIAGDMEEKDALEIANKIQGFYGIVTNFYNPAEENEVVQIEEDVWTDVEPQVYLEFDERPDSMKVGSPEGMLLSSHHEHGHETHGANHFSLAGLDVGSFVTVRVLCRVTPEVDESQADVRLHFLTNHEAQESGLSEFFIEKQGVVMTQGAENTYSDEILISFFVGDTLNGDTLDHAGSFHVQLKSSVDADLEVLGITLYINK